MASVADLVEEPALEQLTGPDEHEAGARLAAAGAVALIEFGPLRVVANVAEEGELARVTLASVDGVLDWSCSCRGQTVGACRHVAAAGMETWRLAPERRGGGEGGEPGGIVRS